MFDRDLQEIIEEENADFLKQANQRATEAKEKTREVILSPLECRFPATILADFSHAALEAYRSSSLITVESSSREFHRRLLQQGLLHEDGDRLFPTGFGLLLFGKEPRTAMRQAGLLASIQYPGNGVERKEFDEAAVLIPDLLEKWLRDKLPNLFIRDRMKREDLPPLPFEMVREAVTNALIHRDYSIEGAKCQITITADLITIKSPGLPHPPITLEQLQKFNAPMLSRNPVLHFVFARMGMAEEQGLGVRSLHDRAKELHLPLPKYSWEAPYLVLTLFRASGSPAKLVDPDVLNNQSKSEQRGWEWLAGCGNASSSEYAEALGLEPRTGRRHLTHFESLGLVKKTGAGPSLRFEVI